MRTTHHFVGFGLATFGLLLAGCGGGGSKSATAATSPFNVEHNRTLTCMAHQTAAPISIDRPGSTDDPASVLAYLRYYTANGNKPYCDGNPASATDRQWLSLYVAGGSSRSNVARALSGA